MSTIQLTIFEGSAAENQGSLIIYDNNNLRVHGHLTITWD